MSRMRFLLFAFALFCLLPGLEAAFAAEGGEPSFLVRGEIQAGPHDASQNTGNPPVESIAGGSEESGPDAMREERTGKPGTPEDEGGELPLPEEDETSQPPASALETRLRAISLTPHATVWSALPEAFPSKYREQSFPLKKAVNLGMVERFTGKLSKERRAFLQKHRFLLIPQEECLGTGSMPMLELFAKIGSESFYQNNTTAPNALFVGPDPFLHALHRYVSTRMQYMEESRLSLALLRMLEGLFDNAGLMRKAASTKAAASFDRLQGQFLVPLIILRSALPGGEGGVSSLEQARMEKQAREFGTSLPASRERIFELLKTYDISADNAAAIRMEIEALFSDASVRESPLLSRHYGRGIKLDYSRFTPRGEYEQRPVMRSYFRAVQWLGALAWDVSGDATLMDAINYALLMSMTPGAGKGLAEGSGILAPCEYWRKILELTSFFVGPPGEAAYPEWARYLQETIPQGTFSAETAVRPEVLEAVRNGASSLAPSSPFFSGMRRPQRLEALRVFPPRFLPSRLIADELTRQPDQERTDLPALYSPLWVPAVLGSPYALEFLEAQVAASMKPQSVPTPFTPAGDTENSPAVTAEAETEVPEKAVAAMRTGVQRLSLLLGQEDPAAWSSSISAAWLRLLQSLVPAYGKDMPLYMQSRLFRVRRLEAFLASLAEAHRDAVLYDSGIFDLNTTAGPLPRIEPFHPIPNGFVEPDLPFWHGMLAVTGAIEDFFAARNLFEEDRQEGGVLHRFRQQISLCAALAEKELRGKRLSKKDYASLRNALDLTPMARPLWAEEEPAQSPEGDETIGLLQATGTHLLYAATDRPYIMLVLVGNEQAPRLTVGVAYNYREFVTGREPLLTEEAWRQWIRAAEEGTINAPPLPPKPFWYEGLEAR